ncbi:VWA domain-containing protein [Desulfosoma sp.]|uniref:VWA domain-containing protein n=1 Tax=Desulfosoma sp. TaxID=2603217 RepID=UPI0040491A83
MIRNLQSQDFAVTEDEVEQSPLALETHLPSMAMALVLDTSGSMKGAIETAGRAASSSADLVRPENEKMFLTFSDRVQVAETFSKDKEAVKKAIGAIKARGNTALYDAAWQAVRSFEDKAGRKAVILLTDGYDGFQKVASVAVDNTRMESQDPSISLTVQTFPLPETKARWIKIVLLNNYGGSYVQLGEIKLMGFFTADLTSNWVNLRR